MIKYVIILNLITIQVLEFNYYYLYSSYSVSKLIVHIN